MNKKEVGMLLDEIDIAYPMFLKEKDPEVVFKTWFKWLKDYEFEAVDAALTKYVQANDYPPKINQLIQGINKHDKAYLVPSKEETKALLKKWEEEDAAAALESPTRDRIAEILRETAGEDFLLQVQKRGKNR